MAVIHVLIVMGIITVIALISLADSCRDWNRQHGFRIVLNVAFILYLVLLSVTMTFIGYYWLLAL